MKLKLRPSLALPVVIFLLLLSACRREESLETGYTSAYSLQDTFGICYTSNVVGAYRAGQVLGDSSYLELSLFVNVPGRYSINTDLQNGFSFTGTGTFNDTGMTTIRIPARGTPVQEGVTTLRLVQDSSYCEINVTVLGAGPINGGGTCNATVAGNFKKDTALTAANTVTLQHNFAAAGTYSVTTDTVNGYYFNKTVTVTTAGNQTITLDGFGTPAATGANNFSVRFGDGTSCGFPITVVAGSTGGGGGCGTVNGTFTAGTATTSANTFTSTVHTYATSGTYNVVVTPTAPGLSASTVSVTATSAGSAPAITVPLSGTPTTAGTYTANVDFGDGTTCSLSLTVLPAGTTPPPGGDYFPLGANSYWTYDDGTSGDTVKRVNEASATLGTTTYRLFRQYNNIGNQEDSFYFRKDAGTTYMAQSLEDLGFALNVTFPAGSYGELPIVKDALTTGATWLSAAYTGSGSSSSTQLRVQFTCVSNNATLTLNGHTFTNVYQVSAQMQFNMMNTGWQNMPFGGDLGTSWYAPGVGLIQAQAPGSSTSSIRYWSIQ
ncbi:hypothetical protein [Flaviaesturariibacter aridisoli]|uniref:Uncharacterized protein n=1 Tax=Flaviaesturariibacter aridisoli TaxID=2545761 RepID=A0A4R4E760_9BACT|nr:hypothetical protein [Flaviaesturariibacter aridisoli]TCZ74753.1 hypothetical protein E0486_00165 [Flaviaesturariibacter aridisoli]